MNYLPTVWLHIDTAYSCGNLLVTWTDPFGYYLKWMATGQSTVRFGLS